MAAITLRDVEKFFGANYVIRKLNLEIADREFVVLLGPSGCGKTTTLRAIAGLETIDSGDILIDGKPVQDLPPGGRDIAFVFQLFALYPHLTAFDNIAFPLRATGETAAEIERKVRDVAVSLRIEDLLSKRPSQLSGGDMQRVAIGRALVRRPKALLMDEPIGALDAKLREDMRAELKRLHIENGTTSVYVTHDQVEAMSLADRVAVMNDGVLQQVGTPSDVYLNPVNLFVAQFVGSPVMNIVPAEIRADGARRAYRSAAGRPSPFRATWRRGCRRRCPPGTSWCWGSGPRRSRSRARPGWACSRCRRTSSSRSGPTTSSISRSASGCSRRARRAGSCVRRGMRSGRGWTRRRCISSMPRRGMSLDIGLAHG